MNIAPPVTLFLLSACAWTLALVHLAVRVHRKPAKGGPNENP